MKTPSGATPSSPHCANVARMSGIWYDRDPTRIVSLVVAVTHDIPSLLMGLYCIFGPGRSGMAPRDAAQEVTRRLALTPAEGGARAAAPTLAETKEAAVEQGNGLYAQHRYEEAVAAYDRALALDSHYVNAWYDKGYALGASNATPKP